MSHPGGWLDPSAPAGLRSPRESLRKPRRAPVGGKTPPPPPTGILRTEVLVPTKALTKDLKRRLGMEVGFWRPEVQNQGVGRAHSPPPPTGGPGERPSRLAQLLGGPVLAVLGSWQHPSGLRLRHHVAIFPSFLWGRQSCCIKGPPSPVPLAFPWLHLQRPPSQTGAHSQVLGGHDVLRGCYSTGKRMAWKHRASPPPGAGAGMPAAPTKRSGSHVQGPLLPRSL